MGAERQAAMEIDLIERIRRKMSRRPTDDLLAIWAENDLGRYSPETFQVISEVLAARDAELPGQQPPGRSHCVYEHPDGRRETIKNGFSWPAVLFGVLWALAKQLMPRAMGLLVLNLVLAFLGPLLGALFGYLGIAIDIVITLGVLMWIGDQGNEWLRKDVRRRGFKLRLEGPPGFGGDVDGA